MLSPRILVRKEESRAKSKQPTRARSLRAGCSVAPPRRKEPFWYGTTKSLRMTPPRSAPDAEALFFFFAHFLPSGPGQASDTSARTEPLTTHPPLEVILLHVAHGGACLRRQVAKQVGIRGRSAEPRLSPATASNYLTSMLWRRQRKMALQSLRSAPDTQGRGGIPGATPRYATMWHLRRKEQHSVVGWMSGTCAIYWV